ncbi:MAG: DUF4395 domain-containing protein [Paludibacter sp.]|nr:DUF4395 domain-containing protein [Paludibacter sp.]
MKSNAFCPISDRKIDEHVARLNGGITLSILAVFIISGNLVPIFFLIVDFALRSGKFSRYSVLSYISKNILKSLKIKPDLINAGPKIFAARIGLIFNIAIFISFILGLSSIAFLITGIFAICAFLESVFGFCVACQIYPFVYKLLYFNKIQKAKI